MPLGYTVEACETRGERVKKRLVEDPVEAEIVRMMFRLYRVGDGTSGPLGVKAVTTWLNERGYRTRLGARFGVATVHGILTNPVYVGEWTFNRMEARTRAMKPASEHIRIEVPALISREDFETVARTLKAHNPRVTPAREVTGPILLTGLATCAHCGAAMTLRTGTSKSGKVHRYYSCSTHGRQGKAGCRGRSIPMQKLDELVTDHLSGALLQPDRLQATLASLWTGREAKQTEVNGRVAALRAEVSTAEDKLRRLYQLVEDGVTDLDDMLKERLAILKANRDLAKAALDRIHAAERPPAVIAPELVREFGILMRKNIAEGPVPFRKAWLQSIVDRIEVDADTVRIIGDKANLEQVIAAASTGALKEPGVRSSVRKWRARKDSNL